MQHMDTVQCASCDKTMPLSRFGLTEKSKFDDVRYLCQDCYDDAIAEARKTHLALFPCIRVVNILDGAPEEV